MSELLRHVPSVEKLLQAVGPIGGLPRSLITAEVRAYVEGVRHQLLAGTSPISFSEHVAKMCEQLTVLARTKLQPVINGTGVLIHTNLGRSPLNAAAAESLRNLAEGWCNLELDLESGTRGHRGAFVEKCLAQLGGAEAATAVNNCASALVLILRTLISGEKREVLISRSELVEIGGGFRVPDILETSGAVLREVGTTNKTTLCDYEQAISPATAMILKVHRSNFYIEGFTAWPELSELAALAHRHGLPLVEDLGSGAMIDSAALNTLEHEPTAAESLAAGADLVCVSGDKLFGGPQAGIIFGKSAWIAKLKRDPFFRVLRCDKLILLALQETALAYLSAQDTPPEVPLVRLLSLKENDLLPRTERLASTLGKGVTIGQGVSRCGGGTMPKSAMPSITLDLTPPDSAEALAARLRQGNPPVMAYIEANKVRIDLRTVFESQDSALHSAIKAAMAI